MASFALEHLTFTYPGQTRPALSDLTLTIPEGAVTVLCGESGSGKSTLLRQLKTCLTPHGTVSGAVRLGDALLKGIPFAEQARRIGFVLQHPDDQIVTDKVFHELAFGLESLGCEEKTMRLCVAEMASYFGIADWFDRDVAALSGGQKQMLNLASVVVMRPDVLILDEPTSQLDPIAASTFLHTLRKLNEELGLTILLSEQRLEEAVPLADHLIVLEQGRLLAAGAPQEAAAAVRGHAIFSAMPTAARIAAALGETECLPLTVRAGRAYLGRFAPHPMPAAAPAPVDTPPVLTVRDGWFRYAQGSADVLRNFSLTLRPGELYALTGSNGSGKTTALGVLSGRLRLYRGSVYLDGKKQRALQPLRDGIAAGSAVGLGNLWGFPYKTSQNGGAAFVLIYIACVLLIGFVTMLSEIYLGLRSQANPMTAYKMVNKNLGWCGLVAIMIPAFIICYYSVLGGWTTKYALNSFSGNAGIVSTFSVNTGEVILYTALFLVLSVTIIMGGVKDGIEKASKVLMPVLFLILVAIAIYALTLGSGVREGLAFYLKPDFSGITFKSVLVAMGQAFYSLSLGMGIMITYGSYTGKEVNLVRSTAMVCVFDTVVALLAGLAIFPSVAHFDPSLLGSSKGVALMFIILPQVFESMGSVGQVVSFAFFVMVDIAAITSVVSLIEVVTQFVIQKFHVHRKRAALVVACVCFVVSIPIGISLGHVAILEEASPALFGLDWLTFFDEVTNTVLMPVCALFSCIVVGWFITPKRAVAEIEAEGTHMAGWLKKVYAVMIRFVTPALILIVEIGGLQSEIAAGNTAVIVFAYALVALCVAAYFLFFRNTDTGTNADEKLSGDYPV